MTRRLELEPATDVGTDLDRVVFWPTVAAQSVRARTLLAALYPACRRFAELKRRRSDGWLAYL